MMFQHAVAAVFIVFLIPTSSLPVGVDSIYVANAIALKKTIESNYTVSQWQSGLMYAISDTEQNCTAPSINDFPPSGFDLQGLRQGGALIYCLLAVYTLYMICSVVIEYFMPSLEIITTELKMSPDVAGATIMAIGTSVPELFVNIIGTFLTQGDIGVGTGVGGDVVVIIAAPALCVLITGLVVVVDCYSFTRGCLFYAIAVILVATFISDEQVHWWEAMILVLFYATYIFVMLTDGYWRSLFLSKKSETTGPVINSNIGKEQFAVGSEKESVEATEEDSISLMSLQDPVQLCTVPTGTWWMQLLWFVSWPSKLLFYGTIPDVRRGGKWRSFYLLAFVMCIVWIGGLSYLLTWCITILGYALGIPNSAMGISIMAAGGALPQAVGYYVVSRQGQGGMAISSAFGSNIFGELMCMGLPWLIKSIADPEYPELGHLVVINSGGVIYDVIMLFCAVVILYSSIALNGFRLDKKISCILLLTYIVFVTLAVLIEFNVFVDVNAPTCDA